MCSTPGGIGAAITAQGEGRREGVAAVLNARGHRGGDHPPPAVGVPRVADVLNARGHRGGDHRRRRSSSSRETDCAQRPGASGRRSLVGGSLKGYDEYGAQRPGASGRRSHRDDRRGDDGRAVLNARGHRGGDHRGSSIWSSSRPSCSTPGGIGAAITMRGASSVSSHPCAQRPGASGRRSPEGARVGARLLRVLNARGHRGGDHTVGGGSADIVLGSAQRPGASGRRSL